MCSAGNELTAPAGCSMDIMSPGKSRAMAPGAPVTLGYNVVHEHADRDCCRTLTPGHS